MLYLFLDRPNSSTDPVRLGPFRTIEIAHRRLRAGDIRILRHFDGGWHWGDHSYLEARIETSARHRAVRISYEHSGGKHSPADSAAALRLYGDRLLSITDNRWVATDDDDARCWVVEATGLVSGAMRLAAA